MTSVPEERVDVRRETGDDILLQRGDDKAWRHDLADAQTYPPCLPKNHRQAGTLSYKERETNATR